MGARKPSKRLLCELMMIPCVDSSQPSVRNRLQLNVNFDLVPAQFTGAFVSGRLRGMEVSLPENSISLK